MDKKKVVFIIIVSWIFILSLVNTLENWNSDSVYLKGTKLMWDNAIWEASEWTQGDEPGSKMAERKWQKVINSNPEPTPTLDPSCDISILQIEGTVFNKKNNNPLSDIAVTINGRILYTNEYGYYKNSIFTRVNQVSTKIEIIAPGYEYLNHQESYPGNGFVMLDLYVEPILHTPIYNPTPTPRPPAHDWKSHISYKKGNLVRYQGNDYICEEGHTSLLGWEPPNVPMLWSHSN